MLRVNFSAYNTYVTDSLFQWDKNRKLVISGLNLPVAPEIRFTNEIMDKSIVRQSKLEEGIITACIPNSLLQYHYTIKAYVGIYENDAFKTLEIIHIPVNPQERPLDYVLTDSDDEIYSFNALDNKVEASLVKYNQASGELQESVKNYELARQEFIEGIKEANKSFKLSKIYTSITEMNLGYATDDVPLYGFVLINTGDTNDIDNAKLFVKTETQYDYVAYLIGLQGEKGEPFTYEDFTPEQLEALRGPQGIQGIQGEPGKDGVTPTIQDWLGTEPIGSPTTPLYYDGEKFVAYEGFIRPVSLEEASWDFIAQVAENGTASQYFRVGEEKSVLLDNGLTVRVAIMGFNEHPLADGTGKAGITFVLVDLYEACFGSVNRNSSAPEFPSAVKMYIKTVKKLVESDTISVGFFPISIADLDHNYFKTYGKIKYSIETDGSKKVSAWWLSDSPNNSTSHYYYLSQYGSVSNQSSSTDNTYKCFGFCI